MITGSADRTARVWDAASGHTLLVLEGHQSPVTAVGFSADGKKLVTASEDKTIRIWSGQTGNSIVILRGHADVISDVSFSADDQLLVSSSNDGTARIWNADLESRDDVVISGHRKPIFSVAYNIDGSRIATASGDGTVRVWSSLNGELQQKFLGHSGRVFSVAFSHDDRHIVTSSDDHTARIWDVRSGLPAIVLGNNDATIYNARFSPDDKQVATASDDGTVRIWDAATGSSISELKVAESSSSIGAVYKLLFTPQGDKLISATEDGALRIWDIRNGKVDKAFTAGDTGPVFDLAISADGAKVVVQRRATATRDFGKLQAGKLLMTLHDGDDPLLAIAMNSSATIAVTGSWNRNVRVWDLQTGKPLADQDQPAAVFGLALNPNDRQIASASRDSTAHLFSLRSLGIGPSPGTSSFGAKFADIASQNSSVPELLDQSKAAIARCLTRAEREAVFVDPALPSWCTEDGKWPAAKAQ